MIAVSPRRGAGSPSAARAWDLSANPRGSPPRGEEAGRAYRKGAGFAAARTRPSAVHDCTSGRELVAPCPSRAELRHLTVPSGRAAAFVRSTSAALHREALAQPAPAVPNRAGAPRVGAARGVRDSRRPRRRRRALVAQASRTIVTGPSFTSSTFISAPNTPVSTW